MRGKVFGWMACLMPLTVLAEPPATLPTAIQVLNVLQLAEAGPAVLTQGFKELGFEVIDEADDFDAFVGSGVVSINLDLWQAGQPLAHARCVVFGPADIETMGLDGETELDRAAMQPFSGGIGRRIVCGYDYWSPETVLTPFIVAATDWGDRNIGPLQPVNDPFAVRRTGVVNLANIGSDAPWVMQIGLLADGDEAQMVMFIIKDVPSPTS